MEIRSGVATSHNRNPVEAAREAAEGALRNAGIEKADFALVFASVGYQQAVIVGEVSRITGGAVSGCSAEGVIADHLADESNFCVAVMVISSDELRVQHGVAQGLGADPEGVGRSIGESIAQNAPRDPIALLVFPDGMTLNFDKMVAGLSSALPETLKVPMLGGSASDNLKFERTYQYCDDQVTSDGVSWALLSGPAKMSYAVNHGCVPVGVEHKVTRSSGNVIHELDGRPAVSVLKDYVEEGELGDWVKVVLTLNLGLQAPDHLVDGYDQYLIRTIVGRLDEGSESFAIADDVVEGTSLWVTRRDYEKLRAGVDKSCDAILAGLDGEKAQLVFHFDCVGRGKSFLREAQKQNLLEHMQDRLGKVPWIGFYCYGEISPVAEKNSFHNLTMVLAALH